MVVKMKNSFGAFKEAPVGFSWTTLLLGCLVPLFRGDFKWALITFALAWVSGGISWFIVPFFYNKVYLETLVDSGYLPVGKEDFELIKMRGLLNPVRLSYIESKMNNVSL